MSRGTWVHGGIHEILLANQGRLSVSSRWLSFNERDKILPWAIPRTAKGWSSILDGRTFLGHALASWPAYAAGSAHGSSACSSQKWSQWLSQRESQQGSQGSITWHTSSLPLYPQISKIDVCACFFLKKDNNKAFSLGGKMIKFQITLPGR